MKKIVLTTVAAFFLCNFVLAQVSIAPTNLFIESNSGFGTYMVINNSDQNQEISISFNFAYSQSDEEGNRSQVRDDSVKAEQYSIADQIRAFPQNFILNPGQRQVVRLRVTGTQDLSDGVYWSRIHTVSTAQSPPVEIGSDEEVRAQLGINFEQITGVFYKKGDVSTGIGINEIRSDILNNESLQVLIDYERLGNAPFLGSIYVSLIDANGNVVKENFTSTSLYFDGTHKQLLDISDVNPGNYSIKTQFETKRSDVSNSDLVQMQTETKTIPITIP